MKLSKKCVLIENNSHGIKFLDISLSLASTRGKSPSAKVSNVENKQEYFLAGPKVAGVHATRARSACTQNACSLLSSSDTRPSFAQGYRPRSKRWHTIQYGEKLVFQFQYLSFPNDIFLLLFLYFNLVEFYYVFVDCLNNFRQRARKVDMKQ